MYIKQLIACMVKLSVVLIVGGVVWGAAAGEGKRDWNFVVFFVDDLGWTDMGYSGSDFHKTPNIDKLARSGMIFTNGYSACTVCSPSRAAMMTGMYPARLRVTDFINGHVRKNAKLKVPDWTKYLEKRHVTIAEALKGDGYKTAHIGKWHLAPRNNEVKPEVGYPEQHGFDVNVAGNEWGQPPSYHYPYARGNKNNKRHLELPGKAGDFLTDALTDQAEAIIEKWADEKFYMYFSYYTVHTPIQGRKDLVAHYKGKVNASARHKNATYAAMIHSLDDSVGRVVKKLAAKGIADRTVILFTGDNGGLSHRGERATGITTNKPLRAGKGSTYEGGVRVPTFMVWPGVTKPGQVSDEPVITVDYYPTLLEIAGVKGDERHNGGVDGESLVRLLRNPKEGLSRDAIYFHFPHYHPGGATPYGAIRAGDWKLIEFFEDDRVELYHLKNDIGEAVNLANKRKDIANQLKVRLVKWRESVKAQMPTRVVVN